LLNQDGKGYGRAWITPVRWKRDAFDPIVVYNGYARSDEYVASHTNDHTRFITNMLVVAYNLRARMVRLINNGSDAGTLYINGGRGFVLSRNDIHIVDEDGGCNCQDCREARVLRDNPDLDIVDLNIPRDVPAVWSNYIGDCDCCGEALARGRYMDFLVYKGPRQRWCKTCYAKIKTKYQSCATCGIWMDPKITRAFRTGARKYSLVCPECASRNRVHVRTCDDCGAFENDQPLFQVADDVFCIECSAHYLGKVMCAHCGAPTKRVFGLGAKAVSYYSNCYNVYPETVALCDEHAWIGKQSMLYGYKLTGPKEMTPSIENIYCQATTDQWYWLLSRCETYPKKDSDIRYKWIRNNNGIEYRIVGE
jgi:hypothetical protein